MHVVQFIDIWKRMGIASNSKYIYHYVGQKKYLHWKESGWNLNSFISSALFQSNFMETR